MSGIKDKVAIIGMGCSRFGERYEASREDLILEAVQEALDDAGLTLQDLGVYVMVAITAISGYTYLKDNFAIFKDGFSSGKKGE